MSKALKEFIFSHVILSACLLGIFFMSALVIFASLVIGVPQDGLPPGAVDLAIFTLAQLVLTGFILMLMKKIDVFETQDYKVKRIGRGFLIGWVGIVIPISVFFINFTQYDSNSFIKPELVTLIVTALHPFLGTGLFEEVLFRGLILKLLLVKLGCSKKGIIQAAFISSIIFGIVHIVNYIVGAAHLLPTLTQVIFASAGGVFYAAIYLRTRNLLIPIFMHGLFNIAGQIFGAVICRDVLLINAQARGDVSIVNSLIVVLTIGLPKLIAGIVLLRKVKPEEKTDDVVSGVIHE